MASSLISTRHLPLLLLALLVAPSSADKKYVEYMCNYSGHADLCTSLLLRAGAANCSNAHCLSTTWSEIVYREAANATVHLAHLRRRHPGSAFDRPLRKCVSVYRTIRGTMGLVVKSLKENDAITAIALTKGVYQAAGECDRAFGGREKSVVAKENERMEMLLYVAYQLVDP